MAEPAASHAGIELDVICLSTVTKEARGTDSETTATDPDDYRVFVHSIFRKMTAHDSFLSFSGQISNVNKILTMKYSSAGDIARVILKDLALTAKVLKLVNSSFYRHFAPKGISTISEAMIILGTEEVRLAAASLKVYEMMQDIGQTGTLKDMTLKGLQRSMMARQMAKEDSIRDVDYVQVAAMIYDLGEYLVALFAPDKYVVVAIRAEEEDISLQEASKAVLGISYNDLGRIVGLKLHLPENIVNTMRPVNHFEVERDQLSVTELSRYMCGFAKEICDIPDNENRNDHVLLVVNRYGNILNVDMPRANELLNESREKTRHHAEVLKINPGLSKGSAQNGVKNKKQLDAGLRRIQKNLESRMSIHEIFTNMVNTLYESFYFSDICISIKKKETGTLNARFAAGSCADRMMKGFVFKLADSPDVFNAAVAKDIHKVVRDTAGAKNKKIVPSWYREQGFPDNFAVVPVYVDGKAISMLYVSWLPDAGGINQKTIEYLHVFKELMIRAFTLHQRK